MSVQGLPRQRAAVVTPPALTAARLGELVQTFVFYGLVALGIGTPIVLALYANLTR